MLFGEGIAYSTYSLYLEYTYGKILRVKSEQFVKQNMILFTNTCYLRLPLL
jgi:hypothetical protein